MREISETLREVRYFLNDYVDSLMDRTIAKEFLYLKKHAANALRDERGINKMIDDITERKLHLDIDENIRHQIYEAGLRAPILRFEREAFNGIRDRVKESKRNIKKLRKWLLKLWKALNIIINSLISVFRELDVVKEFKEHLENLTGKERNFGEFMMPISK